MLDSHHDFLQSETVPCILLAWCFLNRQAEVPMPAEVWVWGRQKREP